MTPEQCRSFLAEGTRTAKLASVRADGRPHVAPVWFLIDGDSLVFTTGRRSVKGRNLLVNPRVMVCADDERPPYTMVVVEGTATISEDAEALLEWATRIAARYVGPERSEEFGRRNGAPGALLVCVTMEKLIGYDGAAD